MIQILSSLALLTVLVLCILLYLQKCACCKKHDPAIPYRFAIDVELLELPGPPGNEGVYIEFEYERIIKELNSWNNVI